MKRLLVALFVFVLHVCLVAQDSGSATASKPAADSKLTTEPTLVTEPQNRTTSKAAPEERMFFPRDWYWGWAQFDLAPPHNEVDPNLCAANAGQYGGKNAQCSAFARYMISGTIELRPFGQTWLRGFEAFFDPTFLFGKTVPQYNYTWSWSGIGMEYAWGIGYNLPKQFEVRFTGHPVIQRFGSRDQPLGPAWLGSNGPWGQYNTIGVRKYFGIRREGTY